MFGEVLLLNNKVLERVSSDLKTIKAPESLREYYQSGPRR